MGQKIYKGHRESKISTDKNQKKQKKTKEIKSSTKIKNVRPERLIHLYYVQ